MHANEASRSELAFITKYREVSRAKRLIIGNGEEGGGKREEGTIDEPAELSAPVYIQNARRVSRTRAFYRRRIHISRKEKSPDGNRVPRRYGRDRMGGLDGIAVAIYHGALLDSLLLVVSLRRPPGARSASCSRSVALSSPRGGNVESIKSPRAIPSHGKRLNPWCNAMIMPMRLRARGETHIRAACTCVPETRPTLFACLSALPFSPPSLLRPVRPADN